MLSQKSLWSIKKFNGLLLVILIMIQAHFIMGRYYSAGTISYELVTSIYGEIKIKLFSIMLNLSLAVHIFTTIEAVSRLKSSCASKRKRARFIATTLALILFLCTTYLVWRV